MDETCRAWSETIGHNTGRVSVRAISFHLNSPKLLGGKKDVFLSFYFGVSGKWRFLHKSGLYNDLLFLIQVLEF